MLIGRGTLLFAGAASAGIHTWDVNEVFSNADGTIQYVELVDNGTGGNEINVGNGSLSSSLQSISWSQGQVSPPTTGRKYLIATPGFAALAGAPTPDVIMDPSNVPFFDVAGDSVAFGSWDSWTFAGVPTNGIDSLDRTAGVGQNSPENYAGETGSVDASPAPPPPPPPPAPVPASSTPALLLSLLLIGSAGALLASRRGRR